MDKHGFRNIQKKLKLTDKATAKVLGVELIQVQMWACGVWPVPRIAENFLHSLQNDLLASQCNRGRSAQNTEGDYYRGYKDGYKDGHYSGHREGREDGAVESHSITATDLAIERQKGYTDGYYVGYDHGGVNNM